MPPVLGLQLDLLLELARGGELRVLALLRRTDPGRELDEDPAAGVAVLPDAADPLLVVDGEHHDGARVLDDEPAEGLVGVARALHDVLAQHHHPVVAVDVARAQRRASSGARRRVAPGTVERRVASLLASASGSSKETRRRRRPSDAAARSRRSG